MSWLTKKLEEATAQINPFDGGRTASTVRAARNPVPPAQTMRGGFKPLPQQALQVAAPRSGQTISLPGTRVLESPELPQPPKDTRNLASKLYDQINVLDNNRTFKQPTPTQNKSVPQQLGQAGGQTARAAVGGTARFLNTAATQVPQAYGTGRMLVASATNNPVAFRNASNFTDAANQQFQRGQGGLLNTGTLYGAKEAERGDLKTGAQRIIGGAVESGLEVGSLGVSGVVGKELVKQGIKKGLTTQLPNMAKSAALNTGQGAAVAYNQGGSPEDIAKNALLSGAVGTAADLTLGVAGAGAAKLAPQVTTKLVDYNAKVGEMGLPQQYRLGVEDRRVLADYTDYLAGNSGYSPRPGEVNNLVAQAMEIGRKTGLDVTSGSPRDRYLRIGDFLENFDTQKQSMLQGGYVKNPLASDAEQIVFDQNPMLPENSPILKGKDAGKTPEQLPEFNTKKVKAIDKVFRSTRSIIERQGESGKRLGGMLQKSRDTQELYLADLQKRLPTLRKLKGKDFDNFVDATQGIAEAVNDKVAKAVQEWQAVHPGIRERAVAAGLDVGDLGPNYYPHFIDYDKIFKDKNTYNEAINHLVKTGQAQTPEDAIKLLGYARDVSRNREFGNLEASRLVDLPFYDRTSNSLMGYLSGSTKRTAQTETFGKSDEKALELIKKIGLEGGDTEAAKNAYDIAVGAKRYNPSTEKASRIARQYVTTTRLGLGAITNISQNVNTGIVTGHMRTLKSMLKQLDPKTRAFVGDTGVIADAVLNDLRAAQGDTFSSKVFGKVLQKVTAPGFNAVEKFNRSVSATAGRDYALRLAQKGDEKTLRKLGVTGEIKDRTLTEAQQVQAARKVVEKTQFKVDAQDLPGWVDSPGGKLVAQFRSFSYNQGKFFSNEVLKPAARGNLMPLARVLAAMPVGYALAETKRAINARPTEENEFRKGVEAFGNIGGAGLAVDIFRSLYPLNGKYLPSDRAKTMTASTIGGPAAGVALEGVGGVFDVVQRKKIPEGGLASNKAPIPLGDENYLDATAISRFGMKQIPVVGSRLQNSTLPYKEREDAESPADSFKQGLGSFLGVLGKPFTSSASAASKDKPVDIKAAVKEAQKSSKDKKAEFEKKFSKDDYELYKLSDVERRDIVRSGVISQSKFDNLDKYADRMKKQLGLTKNTKQLKGDKRGTELLDRIGEFSKDERTKWESGKFDSKFQDIYDRADVIRPKELPALPKSNKVLTAYSKYLKVKDSKPSELKLNDAKKDFLRDAYQSELSDGAKELFKNYDTDEVINAISTGTISRKDFDAALKVDNLFTSTGLTTSPKVSNTIRREFGLADAPERRGSSSRGRKRGSIDWSKPMFTNTSSIGTTRSLRKILQSAMQAK